MATCAKAASAAESTLDQADLAMKAANAREKKTRKKGKGKMKAKEDEEGFTDLSALRDERQVADQTLRSYKAGEAGVWAKYASWAVSRF